MKKPNLNIQSSFYRLRGWSKGLAPYVARTITLERPIANFNLRRSTACEGIDEYLPLDINGHQQWLRIRGERDSNPVILYLHGGPGGSQMPSYRHYQLGWERDFTIVHWEQRGAGKSYTSRLNVATMTITQLVADALSVIGYLSERFNRADIILLGHSWGSLLGVHVLQERPEGVSAYIGVGQVSNQIESEKRMYQFALSKARSEDNEAATSQLAPLEGYPLVKGSPSKVAVVRYWARHYGFLDSRVSDDARNHARLMNTPEYGLLDIYRYLKGSLVCASTLGKALLTDANAQPTALPRNFSVPVFLISGRRDHVTPTDLADSYLDSIQAPDKRHVVFKDSGHYPNEDEPDRFIRTVQELVGPFLDRAG